MIKHISSVFLCVNLLCSCAFYTHKTVNVELPDDYIAFVLYPLDDKLEGESEFLDGFRISMHVPGDLLESELNIESLYSLIRSENVTGTLKYPDGKTTTIEYKIVNHRGSEDIYMKSSLGHFLWEYLSIQDGKLGFAIYWWYCPPATESDLEIIEMTENLLASSSHWHKDDDRDCEDDIENRQWSLFCALKHATIEITGEYNHRNTAIQSVRFSIDDLLPNHGFSHTLMDFNNDIETNHDKIMLVLEMAKKRIKRELLESTTIGHN